MDTINKELIEAVKQGGLKIIKSLLKQGADINAMIDDGNALMYASLGGHIKVVELLIKHGADVDAVDKLSQTALMMASYTGYLDVVKALVAAGADVNAKNDGGMTALMVAACGGFTQIVRFLIDSKADVHAYDERALFLAAREGDGDIVSILVEAGADVNAQNIDGLTALMAAAHGGYARTVYKLLVGGASTAIKSKDGKTAEDLAREEGCDDIVEYLKNPDSMIKEFDRKVFLSDLIDL